MGSANIKQKETSGMQKAAMKESQGLLEETKEKATKKQPIPITHCNLNQKINLFAVCFDTLVLNKKQQLRENESGLS